MRRSAPPVRLACAARLAPLILAVPLIPPAIARAESDPRAASRAALPPFAAPASTVVQVLPPSHDPSVTPSTSLIVSFAEPLDPTTLTPSSFFATGARTGLHTGPITYDPLTQTATFSPNAPFAPGEKVVASVTTAVLDLTGQPAGPYLWTFRIAVPAGPREVFPTRVLPLQPEPFGLFLGDLDGDADLDLASNVWGAVATFPNPGDGSFGLPWIVPAGYQPWYLDGFDMDGDGDLDLGALFWRPTLDGGDIWLLHNDGTGTFTTAGKIALSPQPPSYTHADLDGDGDEDLVTVDLIEGGATVHRNDGAGTFALDATYPVGQRPRIADTGDLDADGDLDLLVTNITSGELSVLGNLGDGTFGAAANLPLGERVYFVRVAPLDGDGRLDAIVTARDTNRIFLLRGSGPLQFAPPETIPVAGAFPAYLDFGDWEADGDLDLLTVNRLGGNVSVLRNDGGSLETSGSFALGDHPYGTATGDLDADGDLEAVLQVEYGQWLEVVDPRRILRQRAAAEPD